MREKQSVKKVFGTSREKENIEKENKDEKDFQ